MVKTVGANIYVSKKNTAILDFSLFNSDETPFEPTAKDRVVFSVKRYVSTNLYIFQKTAEISENLATVKLSADELNIDSGSYLYDLKIFHSDGREETIINPSLFKVEEVINYD